MKVYRGALHKKWKKYYFAVSGGGYPQDIYRYIYLYIYIDNIDARCILVSISTLYIYMSMCPLNISLSLLEGLAPLYP